MASPSPIWRAHIFFCETGSPIPRRADGSSPLIGAFQGRAIYLLFNREAMGFPTANSGNVLTAAILESLAAARTGVQRRACSLWRGMHSFPRTG